MRVGVEVGMVAGDDDEDDEGSAGSPALGEGGGARLEIGSGSKGARDIRCTWTTSGWLY